ncbi:hypothetical protein P152DRAFT_454574 [Eremomyces bilateralis CBS 781.70]|uniref:Localizes primarily to the nucleolus n=1 Tax=Eremomyces bilateralis CBS 781.70 TaxID=1392243 RepID=A0A6G1GE28_9PEZI|nr:uncharacterized protein P152DRAFT_454574 [Eremomyces bilateralis CBS 781.70]KAF1816308.1 hypothetical protein P152DRAFT_454574 [Eremomyces bilateralis CBS 781.70]
MADSISALLSSLKTSLESTKDALPEPNDVLPSKDGMSLLDVKTDLFLSYMQNLVFLIYIKLRNLRDQEEEELGNQIIDKLVELRIFLERGVRPLEGRLKYQIDKVVQAADEAARLDAQKNASSKKRKGTSARRASDASAEGSGSGSGSESESDTVTGEKIDDLSFRPNPAAFVKPRIPAAHDAPRGKDDSSGLYKPPRIAPTALPTTESRKERADRAPKKSATLDEFVAGELSIAPLAEPSIGSTIRAGGRHMQSAKERKEEGERRKYEETNLVRLPMQNKKDKTKKERMGFGGEEWTELSRGVERIEKLTQRKDEDRGALGKSRRRKIDDIGPNGADAGDAWERKKRKVMRVRK